MYLFIKEVAETCDPDDVIIGELPHEPPASRCTGVKPRVFSSAPRWGCLRFFPEPYRTHRKVRGIILCSLFSRKVLVFGDRVNVTK